MHFEKWTHWDLNPGPSACETCDTITPCAHLASQIFKWIFARLGSVQGWSPEDTTARSRDYVTGTLACSFRFPIVVTVLGYLCVLFFGQMLP